MKGEAAPLSSRKSKCTSLIQFRTSQMEEVWVTHQHITVALQCKHSSS